MSLLLFLLALQAPAPGHWPQWRGPDRDNVAAAEKGLLRAWPEGGPKLLWKSAELGDGFPPVTVAGGRIYALGYREGKEWAISLDGSGRTVWAQAIGPQAGEFPSMRFISQRSITVDDASLFAFTAAGRLLCLRSSDGRILWQKEYAALGGQTASFSYSDAPLVDGPHLICKPGGPGGSLAALDKKSGAVVWRSTEIKDRAASAPIIAAEIGGLRQYLVLSHEHVAGIAAKTGKVAWIADCAGQTAVVPTPVYRDGILFVSSGFGVGCHAFRIAADAGKFTVEPLYSGRQMENHRGGMVAIGDHLYAADQVSLKCLELKTGKVVWQDRCVGKGSVTAADGLLIVRGENGGVALVESTPEAFKERGRLQQPERVEPTLSQPVVAGGRLYLRDVQNLYCYDLRGPDYTESAPVWKTPDSPPPAKRPDPPAAEKGPDAAFVSTPGDVVDRMIELAKLSKEDVVYDLGSGDGRIVIAAARKAGCRAVGFEINPELVKLSRSRVAEAKVADRVTIEEKDLFTVDLSPASVVTLYLGAPNNARLLPQLRQLKAGARILSHAHLLGDAGPKPDETVKLTSREDGLEHVIHVWTSPLREPK